MSYNGSKWTMSVSFHWEIKLWSELFQTKTSKETKIISMLQIHQILNKRTAILFLCDVWIMAGFRFVGQSVIS